MSLCCSQTGDIIAYGAPLWAATRTNIDEFCALSREALDQIPESERRAQPGSHQAGDVDIHGATSTQNGPMFTDAYTICGFTLGEFKFSVSRKTTQQYAPNTLQAVEACKVLTTH